MKVLLQKKYEKRHIKIYGKKVMNSLNGKYTDLKFPQGFIIFRERLIILNWLPDTTAVVIYSKNIFNQYRDFFYDVYNNSN